MRVMEPCIRTASRGSKRLEKKIGITNVITGSATSIMAIASVVMAYTVIQNQQILRQNTEALKVAANSLELEEKEFWLRNRPIVVLKKPQFGKETITKDGRVFEHSVHILIENLTHIPANNFTSNYEVQLNEKPVFKGNVGFSAIASDHVISFSIPVQDEVFDLVSNAGNRLIVKINATYSGMLEDDAEKYRTRISFYYVPEVGRFKIAEADYK